MNTRLPTFLLAGLLVLASSAAQAVITPFTFLNGMNGGNEVPAVVSPGTASINSLYFDSAIGTNGTLFVDLSFSGLVANASNAHVHGFSNSTTNSGVLAGLTFTAATSGTITGSWAPANATAVSNLFAGLTYVNLHSSAFPGGELRGQLVPVPESSAAAALAGIGAIGFVALRRRR